MTGILGGQWSIENFLPMEHIPTAVKLTAYSGGADDMDQEKLQDYVHLVETGALNVQTGPVFKFEQLVAAHELMDTNKAGGKIVVLGKQ